MFEQGKEEEKKGKKAKEMKMRNVWKAQGRKEMEFGALCAQMKCILSSFRVFLSEQIKYGKMGHNVRECVRVLRLNRKLNGLTKRRTNFIVRSKCVVNQNWWRWRKQLQPWQQPQFGALPNETIWRVGERGREGEREGGDTESGNKE